MGEKNRRILVLNYEYPPLGGGAANATKYLLREFSHYKNLKIDLVTSSTGKFKVEEISNNVTVHFLNIGKNGSLHHQSNKNLLTYSRKAYSYSKKLMKKEKFDLIHAFFGIPSGFIAMKLKTPYIVSLRGTDVPFYNKRYELLDKLVFQRLSKVIWKKANFVIANSSDLKSLALETSPKEEIGVIHNGVDIKEFIAKKQYSTSAKLKILTIGRLNSRKGLAYLIDAVKDMDNVSLTIVGDGPLREKLEKRAKGFDIKFKGIVPHKEIPKICRENDVFVLPSIHEGMSNNVLEAMASGLPVIITDTGGAKDLIKGNGYIIKKENSKDIKEKISYYNKDRNLLALHGKKSRELAMKKSWSNVAKEYSKLYQKC